MDIRVNRSQFCKTILGVAALPVLVPAAEKPSAARRVMELAYELPAAPTAVFPLLCPVREYDWIETWRAELVYSRTGVAELDCVFTTQYDGARMTWTCCRYEPSSRIEYIALVPELLLMHLAIDLAPLPAGSRIHWRRTYTSLGPNGDAHLTRWTDANERHLGEMLRHYLVTGQCLHQATQR